MNHSNGIAHHMDAVWTKLFKENPAFFSVKNNGDRSYLIISNITDVCNSNDVHYENGEWTSQFASLLSYHSNLTNREYAYPEMAVGPGDRTPRLDDAQSVTGDDTDSMLDDKDLSGIPRPEDYEPAPPDTDGEPPDGRAGPKAKAKSKAKAKVKSKAKAASAPSFAKNPDKRDPAVIGENFKKC